MRLIAGWMMFVLLSTSATVWADEEIESENTTPPELNEIEADRSALPLMQAVCGTEAQLRETNEGTLPTCTSCPAGSSADHGALRLTGGYSGDFSGDGQREAILATKGCGLGFNFRHSTVVLMR